MSRLARYTQQIFGSSAGANQMAEFGSYAASAPLTYSGATITPAIVQTLSNYLSGWFGAIVGANSPAIEDMNALCYLYAYQLSYVMQLGIAEWDSGTTYYIGSICQDGAGNIYISLTNANLNNALSSTANWKTMSVKSLVNSVTTTFSITSAMAGNTLEVDSTLGAFNIQLPAPNTLTGQIVTLKDITGLLSTNNVTLVRAAAESIDALAANYVLVAAFGAWDLFSDGTNWYLL